MNVGPLKEQQAILIAEPSIWATANQDVGRGAPVSTRVCEIIHKCSKELGNISSLSLGYTFLFEG